MSYLEIIGYLSMFLDHIGLSLFSNVLFLRILGRLALPIFIYSVYIGVRNTRNKQKYLIRIIVTAIISQPIYTILFGNYQLNICFTLGFLIILFHFPNKSFLIIFKIVILSLFVIDFTEYGLLGLMIYSLFFFFNFKEFWLKISILLLITYLSIFLYGFNKLQYFSIISIFLIDKKILSEKYFKLNKYLKYGIYPSHLLLIYIIKTLI